MQFSYASTLFTVYDGKLSETCEPFITDVCMNMWPISFVENGQLDVGNDPLAMGTSLFELYNGIQNIVR